MTVLAIAMLISVILIFAVILAVDKRIDKRIDKLTEELKLERHRINMLKLDVDFLWSTLRNGEDNGGEG